MIELDAMHDDEPVRGLPGVLPEGERVLWQGSPSYRSMVFGVFHLRLAAAYLAMVLLWVMRAGIASAAVWQMAAASAGALLLLALLAWGFARTTIYTITNRRIVLRFGIALPKSINLPFAMIDAAGLRLYSDGRGDIPLVLGKPARILFPMLWPHVRPWKIVRAEPMLLGVANAVEVSRLLGRALAAAAGAPVTVAQADAADTQAVETGARAAA